MYGIISFKSRGRIILNLPWCFSEMQYSPGAAPQAQHPDLFIAPAITSCISIFHFMKTCKTALMRLVTLQWLTLLHTKLDITFKQYWEPRKNWPAQGNS